MILYHITKEKYLPHIFTEGLRINSGKTGFCQISAHSEYKRKFGIQPIFLTNIVVWAESMLTPDWINKNKAVLLEVNVELIKDVNYIATTCSYDYYHSVEYKQLKDYQPIEYRYLENIQPKNIKLSKKLYQKL